MASTISNFEEDVKIANADEQFVVTLLNNNIQGHTFEWVGKDEEHYHDGDICINAKWFADVKSDSRVAETNNILAEHRIKTSKGWIDGFMQVAKYDYVFYLSKESKTIYILNFKKWQENYLQTYHRHIQIPHNNKYGKWQQTTDGYLMSLTDAKKLGIWVYTYQYDDDNNLIDKAA